MSGAAVSETFAKKLGVSFMDEKDNASLERGASNDITRLRWRLKICENIIARLVAENGRLRTLATQATPSEGSVQNGCTLTDEERESLKTVIGGFGMWVAQNALTDDESLRIAVVTLRNLLARLS